MSNEHEDIQVYVPATALCVSKQFQNERTLHSPLLLEICARNPPRTHAFNIQKPVMRRVYLCRDFFMTEIGSDRVKYLVVVNFISNSQIQL